MRRVLAAIDASPAARPVLDAAVGFAALSGAVVEAVHVREPSVPSAEPLAADRGIPCRQLDEPVEAALLDALRDGDVILGVVGARAMPIGRRPIGHVALHLVERVSKPLLVVPPDAGDTGQAGGHLAARAPRRLLVPLEGTEETARPVREHLAALRMGDVELVAIHVFTAATAPAMVDHAEWGLEAWSDEFLARHCPTASGIHLRTGAVGGHIVDAADAVGADAIVLSWSQDASAGHAGVVRDVLEHSRVPVLLLPVEAAVDAVDAPAAPR